MAIQNRNQNSIKTACTRKRYDSEKERVRDGLPDRRVSCLSLNCTESEHCPMSALGSFRASAEFRRRSTLKRSPVNLLEPFRPSAVRVCFTSRVHTLVKKTAFSPGWSWQPILGYDRAMTLLLTLASPSGIYQSSDYRLTTLRGGTAIPEDDVAGSKTVGCTFRSRRCLRENF